MKLIPFVLAILKVEAGAADLSRRQIMHPSNRTDPVPIAGSYIVEYALADQQDSIVTAAGITVVKPFNSDIFRGAVIESESYNTIRLQSLPGVLRVWANNVVYLDPEQPKITEDFPGPENYTTHNATGVSKLHEAGVFGKGVKVGIVDTGTWYGHPALGGGFGEGFKVAAGYDFVGDKNWPDSGEKEPDDDPQDQQGHGTHVAGILAGQSDKLVGVAPEATIYSYKVFSQSGGTDEATLVEAFLRAYEDGVDIITSSIGGVGGWAENAWAEVASRIVDQGVVVTISAGNNGQYGPVFGSNGAATPNALAVASVEGELFPSFSFGIDSSLGGETNHTILGYIPANNYFPPDVVGWPIVALSFDTSNDREACVPYPDGTRNLTGVIPLIRRGWCSFTIKVNNLEQLGAEYILFYNNDDPLTTPNYFFDEPLIGLVTAEIGEAIISVLRANGTAMADFSINPENPIAYPNPNGNEANYFTSWGPLYDMGIKPDIAAPGGNIFSAWIDDTYSVLSGTSMACPYVAGVAALYISVHGGRSVHGKGIAREVNNRIVSSAISIPWTVTEDNNYVASVAQVGSGLINAYKAVNYTTTLDFGKLALNDTAHFSGSHEVIVVNNGAEEVSYNFTLEHAAGFEAAGWLSEEGGETIRVKDLDELAPTVLHVEAVLPEPFALRPGESKTVTVDFENPTSLGWNKTALPIYSGKVLLTSSQGERLSIPYLGLGADLKEDIKRHYFTHYPVSESGIPAVRIGEKANYTFDLSRQEQDFPKIYVKTVWGSRQIRWDVYEAGWDESRWTYPPVQGEDGYIGSVASWVGSDLSSYFDPDLWNPDDTFTYPITNTIRSRDGYWSSHWWFGKLGNGSQIELGRYTWRFAILKPFGNATVSGDWEIYDTPEIEVLGKY